MLNDLNLSIFDFETTGLDHEKDRVIEMAAIRIQHGVVVAAFNCFIQQDKPLPLKITELTGITDADLENGLKEDIAFKMLYQMLGTNIIVAHNLTFDAQFLHHGMRRVSNRTFTNSFIDTLTIVRDRDIFPHKLTNLCERYEITLDGAHRALNDVYGCYHLLQKLDKDEPIDEWINKLSYMNKYGPAKWYPAHAITFGADNKYK